MATQAQAQVSIRPATKEDREQIVEVFTKAFIHDPVFSYFANLQELIPIDKATKERESLVKWNLFIYNACRRLGGRIMVVVEHDKPEQASQLEVLDADGEKSTKVTTETKERVVGAAYWLPPKKRLALWKVMLLTKSGALTCIRRWGLTSLWRIGVEYMDISEKVSKDLFRKNKLKGSSESSWFLQQVGITPECQGRGYLTKLMQEAYEHAPGATFVLESTTHKSRDQYKHLGFEICEDMSLGKGRCSTQGLRAKGESAVGLATWVMVKAGSDSS